MSRISILTAVTVSLLGTVIFSSCITSQPLEPTKTADGLSATMDLEVVVKGLDTPWAIDFATDGRIFITERLGRVRIVKNGQLLDEPWITIDVAPGGGSGLLGLALDPEFQQNGFVYFALSVSI